MAHAALSALVLQGGGALGAYELGAARAFYENENFAPDIISGVSIGAITAALLARPAKGFTPLQALEEFWRKVSLSAALVPPPARQYASILGNPNFFTPRFDYFLATRWTSLYDTAPLRRTLARLIDLDALADRDAAPGLLVSALDVEEGEVTYFFSRDESLSLDHIVASGSLPPTFPMTKVGNRVYWDGGLFDNTPLGAVLLRLDRAREADRTIYVVNLFPNKAPVPDNLLEVYERAKNLQFVNKTNGDLKMLGRIDEVVALMEALESLPAGNPLENHPAYRAVAERGYVRAPKVVAITPPEQVGGFDAGDFSRETIEARAEQGYKRTKAVLTSAPAFGASKRPAA